MSKERVRPLSQAMACPKTEESLYNRFPCGLGRLTETTRIGQYPHIMQGSKEARRMKPASLTQ